MTSLSNRTIYAFDSSNIISAGGNIDAQLRGPVIITGDGYKRWSMDVGGISFLFTHLYNHMNDNNVFMFDRRPTYKASFIPNYKGNRDHTSEARKSVFKQRDLAELILRDIGIPTMAEEDFEADDMAYTLYQNYKDPMDHLYFVVNDSDYYFMVGDKCTILPSTSRAKEVNKHNFEITAKCGEVIPYNTIVLHKMLFGEPGDNIPARLTKNKARSIFEYTTKKYVPSLCNNRKYLEHIISEIPNEPIREDMQYMLDAIFPVERPMPLLDFDTVDEHKLFEWGCAIGNRKFGKQEVSQRIVNLLEDWMNEDRI